MACGAVLAGSISMIVTIVTQGGFGGIGSGKAVTVNMDDLPDDLRSEACLVLEPDVLATMTGAVDGPAVDGFTYHISVNEGSGPLRKFIVPEGSFGADALDTGTRHGGL